MQSDSQNSAPIELHNLSSMDRIRKIFKTKPAYEPIQNGAGDDESETYRGSDDGLTVDDNPFAWIEYSIFLLLGIAMLWAW